VLTLVAAEGLRFDTWQIALSLLIVTTWLCVLVRGFHRPIGAFAIALAILWLAGALGFYARMWTPAQSVQTTERIGAIATTLLLALVCFDYLALPSTMIRRLAGALMCIGILVCVALVEAHIEVRGIMPAVQAVAVLGSLLFGMAYWKAMAGSDATS
jgi:hypothetical protein